MPTAEVTFDRSTLYERVREEFRQRCQVEAGTALPSLRQLSSELDVNHLTISRALRDLEDEGLVEVIPRKGIFVRNGGRVLPTNIELVTFNSSSNQYWIRDISSSILRGMGEAANGGMVHGTTLTIPPFPESRDFIKLLQERRVGAVLFLGVSYLPYPDSLAEANFIHQIAQAMPVLAVGSPHKMVEMDSIYGDPRTHIHEYLEACYQKGLRRFGFLGSYPERATGAERLEVFKKFILTHNIQWEDRYVLTYSSRLRADVDEFFAIDPLPEVLLTADIYYASAALMEAQKRGLEPGKDIHLLTFSSNPAEVQHLLSDVSVILIEETEVGRCAYELAQKRILDPTQKDKVTTMRVPARFLNHLLKQ
jgi:DNA-binding LacI/PurR family transcriptional regulator